MTSRVFLALRVPADPARAFEAFTREIASWWQPHLLFQITPDGDGELAFEPGVGGRLVTRLHNGETFEIGRISVWDPGNRLVFTWRQASFSIEHRAWDMSPQRHAARHGFPEHVTLQRVADWWRASLGALRARLTA